MLAQVISNPELEKYLTGFKGGQIVFLEGDESQDLYILVSGQLGIYKGKKKIAEILEPGALFGEMSFFLGAKRTATVRAESDAKTLLIPKLEINHFLQDFPEVGKEITRLLARRLDETSQIVYGLREFCDQLPDAVVLSDREGSILTWNRAAERLYGREWDEIKNRPVHEIYEAPKEFDQLLEEIRSGRPVKEKVLRINHPQKGTRMLSVSTTALYDGQHEFQGVLSLARDVTAAKRLEKKYRRIRIWLMPAFILLALLAAAIFYGYPYFSKGYRTVGVNKHELRNSLAKDYLLLHSLLVGPFAAGDRSKTTELMKNFFRIQDKTAMPYIGMVLLDGDKRVFDAYSIKEGMDAEKMLGNSYGGIEFQGGEQSIHRVLILYRVDKDHPMGQKGVEVAFEIKKTGRSLGWLIFQMDMGFVRSEYGIDEEGLKKFRFKKS